jgi:hypothetical protein
MTPPIMTKYGFRPPEAAYALGSKKLLEEVVAAGWLKPIIQRHKLTLFDGRDIGLVWARILSGEIPPNGNHGSHPLRAGSKRGRR